MAGDKEIKKLIMYAKVLVSLGAIVLVGMAVITAFKNSGLVNNTTADNFITGLGYFGVFIGIMVLAVIGKMVMKLLS